MDYNFSIQIEDEQHSLSSKKGISIKYLWELLRDLYKAIDIEEEAACTLSKIRGNCYALDFTTEEKNHVARFEIVHKNIQELSEYELSPDEKKYAGTLKKILGNKYYLNAFDNEHKKIATIKNLDKAKAVSVYFAHKTIYGVVSEIGAKSLDTEKKHVRIDGIPYNIFISRDMDLKLKEYYGTQKLMIKIKAKLSIDSNRIISAEMLDFHPVEGGTISGNLKKEGFIDFELIRGTNTVNDIIDKIYGNQC